MYIRVRVQPKAKKESVLQTSDTEFVMMVKEPAERNMANTRVRELIAERMGTEMKSVIILTGHRSESKMLNVDI